MKRIASRVAAIALAPLPAAAEVCDKVRPNWDPASGPVSALGEIWLFFTTPAGLFFLALTLTTYCFRSRWLTVVLLPIALGLICITYLWLPNEGIIRQAALREGCLGNSGLVLLAIAGLMASVAWRSFKRR